MPVMDEFKKERAALKNQPLKKKISYFWTYYKWYVLGGVVALAAVISIAVEIVTHRESALFGIVVNSSTIGEEKVFSSGFMEYAGIDPDQYEVTFNSALILTEMMTQDAVNTRELVMVYAASGDMDVAIMDQLAFETYAYSELFFDLRSVLPEEMLTELDGKLYYRDEALARRLEENSPATGGEAEEEAEEITFPDPFCPEEMEEPVPIGIDISGSEILGTTYYYPNKPVLLGIPATSGHVDTAVTFIRYLLTEPAPETP